MKIAIIRRKYNPFGGAEKFISRVINALSAEKVFTTIISESWRQDSKHLKPEHFNMIQVDAKGLSRKAKFLSFQKSVSQILNTHSFDLIQSHERILGADIYRLGDGIHASWVHRQASISPWYKRLWLKIDPYHRAVIRTERAMSKEASLVYVANSSLVQRELIDWYQVPENRIELIENGIDITSFRPTSRSDRNKNKAELGLNPELTTVVFVGSGFARKGAFELAEAIQQLPLFQLIVVGYDKHQTRLKAFVEKSEMAQRVLITGAQKDVKPYLAAADIFCLPSLYDSFPNAILEALCSGLPIVTTEAVGIADAIIENHAGCLCEKESQSIKQALESVSNNQDTLSANALALSKKYDIKIATQRWLNLYNRLILAKRESI